MSDRPVRPADTPFAHEGRCRTRDAVPEWVHQGGGVWHRACSCTVETTYSVAPADRVAVQTSWHRHEPGCAAVALVADDGGVPYTLCRACGTWTHFEDVSRMDPDDRAEYVAAVVR